LKSLLDSIDDYSKELANETERIPISITTQNVISQKIHTKNVFKRWNKIQKVLKFKQKIEEKKEIPIGVWDDYISRFIRAPAIGQVFIFSYFNFS
jgi:hypothetical protein